jgi:nucleotide-binding universal stress UspA family protein
MFNKILVCLDGSGLAEQILPYAVQQTKSHGSEMILLRVVPEHVSVSPNIPGSSGIPVKTESEEETEKEVKEAERYLDFLASDILKSYDINTTCFVARGNAGEVIVNYAGNNDINLIAIATHGRSGVGRAVLGSTADFVIRHSGRPVLTIKPKRKSESITLQSANSTLTRILVCLDGSKLSEYIIPYAVKQAQATGSQLLLLQAVPAEELKVAAGVVATPRAREVETTLFNKEEDEIKDYLKNIAQSIRQMQVEVEWLLLQGEVGEVIVDCALNNNIDMITIATHGRGGLTRTLVGSVADYVLRESGLPILLIRPKQVSS